MQSFTVRNWMREDAGQIEALDAALKPLVLYHGDFQSENAFCAFDAAGQFAALGFFLPSEWCSALELEKGADFVHYLSFEVHVRKGYDRTELTDLLLPYLIGRGRAIKAQFPNKRMALAQYMDADDMAQLRYYLDCGFCFYDSEADYRFDLSGEIPAFPKPEGLVLVKGKVSSAAEMAKYHQAEMEAFDGVSWSVNHTWWMQKHAAELCNFSLFCGDEFVGNTSIWHVSEDEGVTENVFVVPKWRKKGVAPYLIAEALRALREQGKKTALLGTQGDNRKAIRLYHKLGYEMYRARLRVGYELE